MPKDLKFHKFIKPYVVHTGEGFRLKDHDPGDTHNLKSQDKPEATKWLEQGVAQLGALQEILYAQSNWGVLVILQGMDAAGKDGAIKHVMSGVNPQGVNVYPFKAPSTEELSHTFMWKTMSSMPPRGKIAIFNRSHYEEVLAVRVHPELLARQRIPESLRGKHLWRDRYEDINSFERYLSRNGIAVLKFFLHNSRKEQKKRLMERLEDADKYWKFSEGDLHERKFWDAYQDAYEKMIRNTATEHAPWIVVPADNKWFSWLLVVATIVDALHIMNLKFPKLDDSQYAALKKARKQLEKE